MLDGYDSSPGKEKSYWYLLGYIVLPILYAIAITSSLIIRLFRGELVGYEAAYEWPGCDSELCRAVKRKRHSFRRWMWSGLFPYGTFFRDPHYVCSMCVAVPEAIQKLVGDNEAKFQLIDVNPSFKDSSSEILLLFQVDQQPYEYSLIFSSSKYEWAVVLVPTYPCARLFEYEGEIAVLVNFSPSSRGFFLVSLPLQSGQRLDFIPLGTPMFESIAEGFSKLPENENLRAHFCDTERKDFIAFYEYYRQHCQDISAGEKNSIVLKNNFDEFWSAETK